MIAIKIDNKIYNVKTSWRDVSYSDFCKIISLEEKNSIDIITILSGLQYSTIENIVAKDLESIKNLVSFVEDISTLQEYNILSEEEKKFDVGSKSWYKIEKAKQEISKHKNIYSAMPVIFKVYFGEFINDKPITEVWGKVNGFINSINKFFEKYTRLSEYEEDEFEFMANINRFKRFGFFAQCVELSRKMNKSYDEVLAMSARDIYETFLYDFEKSDYEKTLYNLKSRIK